MEENKIFEIKEHTQFTYGPIKLGFGPIQIDSDDGMSFAYVWPFVKGEEKGRDSICISKGIKFGIKDYYFEVIDLCDGVIKLEVDNEGSD
mgnify:CR=1 FL=1